MELSKIVIEKKRYQNGLELAQMMGLDTLIAKYELVLRVLRRLEQEAHREQGILGARNNA